ncbi:hypothetical protein RRG08_034129 [Elysia crispata]|uniref:Uncharacterized protein n=1 Tax=Elysia crispata TaxID=231223 RepID=A0AAE0ZKD6_9GAST|nr:hypothetical protein RRG08_034129 [Elysia crispata]
MQIHHFSHEADFSALGAAGSPASHDGRWFGERSWGRVTAPVRVRGGHVHLVTRSLAPEGRPHTWLAAPAHHTQRALDKPFTGPMHCSYGTRCGEKLEIS